MADSDDDREGEPSGPSALLVGALFGNIDESGELEDGIFSNDEKQHLASLSQLCLQSQLSGLMEDGDSPLKAEDCNSSKDTKSDLDSDDSNYHSPAMVNSRRRSSAQDSSKSYSRKSLFLSPFKNFSQEFLFS